MDADRERLIVAVSLGAGCMLIFVLIVLGILLCRNRCNRRKSVDGLDRHLVGVPSVLSDGRYSSHITGTPKSSPRSNRFTKKSALSSNASVNSGFVYKPNNADHIRKKSKIKDKKKNVNTFKSARSLPVAANVSNYRMEQSPDPPQFNSQYDFSIPNARGSRSMIDYSSDNRRNAAQYGFNQSRLPSREQISFASDGRFIAPGYNSNSRQARPQIRQPPINQIPEHHQPSSPTYAQNVGYHQQQTDQQPYQLRNSDLLRQGSMENTAQTLAYQRYMNGTIMRAEYASENQQYGQFSQNNNYNWSATEPVNGYYSSIRPVAVFDRNAHS